MNQQSGSYVLLIELDSETPLAIGRLGIFTFSRGYYLYAGSALGGLDARVGRHFRGEKSVHWHIDYLLQEARILEVWVVYSKQRLECQLAGAAMDLRDITIPVSGFGSSDCRCAAHLFYRRRRVEMAELQHVLNTISPGCCQLKRF